LAAVLVFCSTVEAEEKVSVHKSIDAAMKAMAGVRSYAQVALSPDGRVCRLDRDCARAYRRRGPAAGDLRHRSP
jgi:hypothetical protein